MLTNSKEIKLYSRYSILIFSVFLTGLGGALMLAYNLRETGKRKMVAPLIILTLIGDAILFKLVEVVTTNTSLRLFVPNIVAAIVLSFLVWNFFSPR